MHTPLPISSLESHLGFWLRFVSNHVSGQFQRKVEQAGVSVSEWVALRQLYGAGESTPGDLIDALGMTKGAVSKIVARLEDKGLVIRSTSLADRRAQFLALTEAGQALVPQLARIADDNDAQFFGHLPEQTRDALMRAMQELVRVHQLKHVPVE